MKKLVELLNEYQYGMFVYENDLLLLRLGSHIKVGGETFIISKQFGFIKWLVENDKINFEGMSGHANIIKYLRDVKKYGWEQIKEGVMIMLLSISDTPIEDLISYLK